MFLQRLTTAVLNLHQITVRLVLPSEEKRFQSLMQAHHYLGTLRKIGECLWYVTIWRDEWIALLSFSAAALKCAVRDQWIGWNYRNQYDRLHLLANNTRFLILPDWHYPNLASKTLSLCKKRVPDDWAKTFGHPLILLETFVDPQRFSGTIYKASNWLYLGQTKGYQRTTKHYSPTAQSPKNIFVQPLVSNAQAILSATVLDKTYQHGKPNMKLTAIQMESLPDFFKHIPDPRRAQGRRHRLKTVLSIAAGATLCGVKGYKAMSDWANSLGQKARARFLCRREEGSHVVPSEFVIRDVLVRVDPVALDRALGRWNEAYGEKDESLAIDGKTMCNAIDEQGNQAHIMSAVGHQSNTCHTQKKSLCCR